MEAHKAVQQAIRCDTLIASVATSAAHSRQTPKPAKEKKDKRGKKKPRKKRTARQRPKAIFINPVRPFDDAREVKG